MIGAKYPFTNKQTLHAHGIEVEHYRVEFLEGRELGDIAEGVTLRVDWPLGQGRAIRAVGTTNRQSSAPVLEGRLRVTVLVEERRANQLVCVCQSLRREVYLFDWKMKRGQ